MQFREYPPAEIVECVQELDYNGSFTVEDVTKPTSDKIQTVYECFLERMLQITREDILHAAQQQLDMMQHPELYEYAVILGVFYQCLNQLMQYATIYDFSPKDITAPTPRRTLRILSGLVNFALFETAQEPKFLQPLENQLESLVAQSQEMEGEIAETNKMIEDRHAVLKEHEDGAVKLREEGNKAQAHLISLKKEVEKLEKAKKEALDVSKPLRAKLSELSKSKQLAEADIRRLELRVVRSPEKLLSSVEGLKRTLEEERECVTALEDKNREFEGKLKVLARYKTDVESCMRVMKEWKTELERADEVEQLLTGLEDQLSNKHQDLKEIEITLDQSQRRCVSLKNQQERNAASASAKRLATQERIAALHREHQDLLEERGQLDDNALKKQNLVTKLEADIRRLQEESEKELERGAQTYRALRTEVQMYSAKLNQALDHLNVFNSREPYSGLPNAAAD